MEREVEELDFPNDLYDLGFIENLQMYLEQEKEDFVVRFNKRYHYKVKLSDFDLLTILGSGSFGKVILAKLIKTDHLYAIKLLEKKHVILGKQVDHTFNEKQILQALRFPFTVHLECFFQDNSYLYFTMPLIIGGEMFTHIRRFGRFDEMLAKFYAAQILLGLEYLHYMELVYRDLKPENILIDIKGYVKISDFGFCKLVKSRTWTLCGTPEYLAPEIILSKGYGRTVDWWAYGVLLYEMCAGYPPFYAKDHLKLYEKIVQGRYKTSSHFSSDLNDILSNLLQVDLSKRFGNLKDGVSDLRNHNWFKLVEWLDLVNCTITAPYIPHVKDPSDISNFDNIDDEELIIRINKSDLYAKEFADF